MLANKYFDVKELVPKEVYEELGDQGSLNLLNPIALKGLVINPSAPASNDSFLSIADNWTSLAAITDSLTVSK